MADERDRSWTELVVKLAVALGFNEPRIRWKLMRWKDRREAAKDRAGVVAAHVAYQHSICGHCGRIEPRGTRTCTGCGHRMEPRFVQQLRRLGVHSPVGISVTWLCLLAIVAAFAKQVVTQGAFFSFDLRTLVTLGAHVPILEREGQWWRLATAVLLHAGVMHLVLNIVALTQIGPAIEEVYGRGRTLLFFMLMGVAANLPSHLLSPGMTGVGASGAVLGLIGMGAGWGQREGTSHGHAVRNQMLQWLLYTTLLGFAFNVDHVAHITGFVVGGVLGFTLHGPRRKGGMLDFALGVTGALLLFATLALIVFPPRVRFVG